MSYFFEGVLGDLRVSGEGVGGGPLRLAFGAGLFFGAVDGLGRFLLATSLPQGFCKSSVLSADFGVI